MKFLTVSNQTNNDSYKLCFAFIIVKWIGFTNKSRGITCVGFGVGHSPKRLI